MVLNQRFICIFQSSETAAHVAARYGHLQVVDYLASSKVDLNVQDNVSYLYISPYIYI